MHNMTKKTFCFDIDGTICTNTDGAYEAATPYQDRIEKINQLFDQGHTIILFTARGSTTGIDWRPTTEQQIKDWKLRCHKIMFGKPFADIYIDDKAAHSEQWFE